MKKLFALAVLTAAMTVATLYTTRPDELRQATDTVAATSLRLWAGIEANPVPVLVALGTFMLTIVYHKLKGKSLRESVEVAATRVTVVAVPAPAAAPAAPTAEIDNAVLKRAQARATRTQLVTDQIGLENRIRKLPDEVRKAEQDLCYAEQAVTAAEEALTKAESTMEAKLDAESAAQARLEGLRKELAAGESEIAAIATELQKLADVV